MSGESYRLWARPAAASENVVAVTADAVLLASRSEAGVRAVEEALARGEPAERALGDAVRVPLDEMQGAYGEGGAPILALFHGPEGPPTRTDVQLADPRTRDEVLAELHRRLGPEWELDDRDRYTSGTLFLGLVVLLVTTVAAFFAVRQYEAGPPEADTARGVLGQAISGALSGTVGQVGVLIIGGVLCALCLWGALHYRKHPPKGKGVILKRIGVPQNF